MPARFKEELRPAVAAFTRAAGRPPGLGLVLVGDDPASQVYVRNKTRSGADVGFHVDLQQLPSTTTLEELLAVVRRLNQSEAHDGILVQSPLPAAMGEDAEQVIFDTIDPSKDVDGFSPVNVGRLVQKRAGLQGLYAGRGDGTARSQRHRAARRQRRGDWPQ